MLVHGESLGCAGIAPWGQATMGPPWGRDRTTLRGGARTTIGGGARLQCGVELEVLERSQGHMNGR